MKKTILAAICLMSPSGAYGFSEELTYDCGYQAAFAQEMANIRDEHYSERQTLTEFERITSNLSPAAKLVGERVIPPEFKGLQK